MELLSIIVPVYKAEEYLPRCLDSLLNQSYSNVEIILVDDGSPDNSGRLCDEYAAKDKRIRVIHQENGGPSKARNTGVQAAKGDYIAFADSDDWVEKDMYKNLLALAKEHDADYVKCGFCHTDGKNKEYEGPKELKVQSERILDNYFTGLMWVVVWNAIYRADLAKKVIYPEGLNFEDNYVCFFYLYYAKKLVISPDKNYNYFINSSGISSKVHSDAKFKLTEALRRDIKKKNIILSSDIQAKMDFIWAKDWFHRIRDDKNMKSIPDDVSSDVYKILDFRRAMQLRLILLKRSLCN